MNESRLRVALTIDTEHGDLPHTPGGAARIVSLLERRGAIATFFLQGRWASAEPDIARRIAAAGHTIGNHSHAHDRMPRLSDEGFAADVCDAAEAIAAATGVDPVPWFRCPYGDGHDDPRVLELLAALGYRDVFWHVDPRDWAPGRGPGDVASQVIDEVRAHGDGAIVVLHSWPDITPAALPPLLDGLDGLGAELVGLGELLVAA